MFPSDVASFFDLIRQHGDVAYSFLATYSMANSLLLNPYQREISNVSAAVSRVGSLALRCLAYAVAADQLARDQRSRQMQLVASGLWMHSIDVASWAYAFARQAGSEPVRIARRAQSLLAGTAESVLEQLNALHEKWGIDEFIIDTPVAEGAARVASLRLLAEARLNKEVTV